MGNTRIVAVALAGVCCLVSGCGRDDERQTQMAIEIPFAVPLSSCPQRAALGLTLKASLTVGGFDDSPCPLDVDPSSLAVSGTCDGIKIRIVRPLGLSYWVPNPSTSESVALAFIVGSVDLREESLGDTATEVSVDLTPDVPITATSVAELLTTNADVQNLRNTCTTITDDIPLQLCNAEVWARGTYFAANPANFDIDNDNESNIIEACNGTLFP